MWQEKRTELESATSVRKYAYSLWYVRLESSSVTVPASCPGIQYIPMRTYHFNQIILFVVFLWSLTSFQPFLSVLCLSHSFLQFPFLPFPSLFVPSLSFPILSCTSLSFTFLFFTFLFFTFLIFSSLLLTLPFPHLYSYHYKK